MKTERINLLVTPEEKSLIDERARHAGLTTSELVRRAVGAYDAEAEAEMDELRALADELAQAVDRTEAKLTATLAKIEQLREALADRETLRAAARAELEASGAVWPFAVVDDGATARGPA